MRIGSNMITWTIAGVAKDCHCERSEAISEPGGLLRRFTPRYDKPTLLVTASEIIEIFQLASDNRGVYLRIPLSFWPESVVSNKMNEKAYQRSLR